MKNTLNFIEDKSVLSQVCGGQLVAANPIVQLESIAKETNNKALLAVANDLVTLDKFAPKLALGLATVLDNLLTKTQGKVPQAQ